MPHPLKLGFVLTALSLIACQTAENGKSVPQPMVKRISWEGHPPISYAEDSTGIPVETPGNPVSFHGIRRHSLAFIGLDTIHLVLNEYARDYEAYAAFGEFANSDEVREGFFREHNDLYFYHGNFIGEIQYARAGLIPAHFVKSNLAFQDEELFQKPLGFQAFPLSGRVPHSERVVLREFQGRKWIGPVFSARYRCHEDTATAFRAFPQSQDSLRAWIHEWQGRLDTLSWGREFRFMGQNEFQEPMVFWVFPEGILGLVGCYDRVLADAYAQKMQKMTVLWTKP